MRYEKIGAHSSPKGKKIAKKAKSKSQRLRNKKVAKLYEFGDTHKAEGIVVDAPCGYDD